LLFAHGRKRPLSIFSRRKGGCASIGVQGSGRQLVARLRTREHMRLHGKCSPGVRGAGSFWNDARAKCLRADTRGRRAVAEKAGRVRVSLQWLGHSSPSSFRVGHGSGTVQGGRFPPPLGLGSSGAGGGAVLVSGKTPPPSARAKCDKTDSIRGS